MAIFFRGVMTLVGEVPFNVSDAVSLVFRVDGLECTD